MLNPGQDVSKNDNNPDPYTEEEKKIKITLQYEDPVKIQRKEDESRSNTRNSPGKSQENDGQIKLEEKEDLADVRIIPSMSTRLEYRAHCPYSPESLFDPSYNQPGQTKPKFAVPMTRAQKAFLEKNRAYTAKRYHCTQKYKRQTQNIKDFQLTKKVSRELTAPSPEPSSAKVALRKVTPTGSWLHPYPQTSKELGLKKPKSGIFINITGSKTEEMEVYDSFDLVYKRKPRPSERKKKQKRRYKDGNLDDIKEEGENQSKRKKHVGKKKEKTKKPQEEEDLSPEEQFLEMLNEEMEKQDGEGAGDYEEYLTKQFRRKVSQISHGTSYQSADYRGSDEVLPTTPEAFSRYVQKFRRDSEVKKYEPKKRKFKRGTLESHSFSDVRQSVLKQFYFGSKPGTMHYGDDHIPQEARTMQGICVPAAAYCYSFLKHPNKWTSEIVDEILDVGSRLYLSSLSSMHAHRPVKELKPEDLEKYCYIGQKKVRFTVDEPEVSGLIKSTDRTVFNLTKALKIFFSRQKAGIFQTQDTNIAIWKDKYFYFFEGKPRTKDLYYNPETGTAIMANFYDVPSIVTVLLQRSSMQNWPFVIYPIKVYKVLDKNQEDDDKEVIALESRSNYNILNENKAILLGSYDLGDKCFGFTRNKQSLTMAVVTLVYSRITPPSAWHKSTVDKIMIIGNQLYIECMQCDQIDELSLSNLPAFFTVGPYIVEIFIYANQKVDMMYKKCCCQLGAALQEFFELNSNGILQLDKKHLAVWKQRNMYFCFDPYPRGVEGFASRDGFACVSMHANLESMVNVISTNFDDKDQIFNLHALKVCKIHRDPVQSEQFPKHIPLDEFPPDHFKDYKMRKSVKKATEKPVTVDYTALAMRTLLLGETVDASIFEIGSTVESLAQEQIPPMLRGDRELAKANLDKLKKNPPLIDLVADLDSPSLSDTQIEPERPVQPKDIDKPTPMDLDSFELTQEEIELEQVLGGEGDGLGMEGEDGEIEGNEQEEEVEDVFEVNEEEMGEGEEGDFYMAGDEITQVRTESLVPRTLSEQVNTDLSFFPIKKDILYPTYVRDKHWRKAKWESRHRKKDEWGEYVPVVPDVTKSEELRKETNFVDLPDDTQIIRGTKNILHFGENIEFISPYVCIMADVVSKKYSVQSWAPEIVDYVLKCGSELEKVSKFRYDQVSRLVIPQISLGKTKYSVLVEYVFDSYVRQNILDLAIEKILFVRSDMGVLVTPTYSCGLIYKNYLYYMFDGFANNEVGLNVDGDGVACLTRFKDVHSLTTRIVYNKRKREANEEVKYTRFVLSSVRVKGIPITEEDTSKRKAKNKETVLDGGEDSPGAMDLDTDDEQTGDSPRDEHGQKRDDKSHRKKHAKCRVGYYLKHGVWVIEGTRALPPPSPTKNQIQEDHFTCLCACLMLLSHPVEVWDTKKVDEVLDYGNYVYSHADDLEISEKRTIKNMLIKKHFFDVIVKMIKIENWHDNKNLRTGIDTLIRRKTYHFLIQFEDSCFLFYRSSDGKYHLFYPQGLPVQKNKTHEDTTSSEDEEGEKLPDKRAGWLRTNSLLGAQRALKKEAQKKYREHYKFYTFEVTSIKKAPKGMLINYRLNQYEKVKEKKPEQFGRTFYEDPDWIKIDLAPWSRRTFRNAEGNERNIFENMWHNWNVEFTNDLYSLVGNISQNSERFSEESRGNQSLCNLVSCVVMLEIYDFEEWNAAIVDSILVNGDQYYHECVEEIKDENYELSMDDLKENCTIFPFTAKVEWKAIVEGTMFLVRNTQFNLYKGLRLFFDHHMRRSGILHCTKSTEKLQVAIGKTKPKEYYMFDCGSRGAPMFLDGQEKAYILRCTSLNRLLHVLTLTLRGGDFYLYELKVVDLKSIS